MYSLASSYLANSEGSHSALENNMFANESSGILLIPSIFLNSCKFTNNQFLQQFIRDLDFY